MPQMSNLWWLPLMMFFSIMMMMIYTILYSMINYQKKSFIKSNKMINKYWQW
uniref:ATP synthase F0 subunit 8 n=2 Tax=Bolivaritettix TaxID=470945 RepID=A0A343K032_9ORTH|nr:ATP synthase F0 subunit 8 [Bolivaritettix sikkinensis]ATA58333.1 ATP synthase F0 subunit 8 [Bolivaritettix yuanbaoshanensis]